MICILLLITLAEIMIILVMFFEWLYTFSLRSTNKFLLLLSRDCDEPSVCHMANFLMLAEPIITCGGLLPEINIDPMYDRLYTIYFEQTRIHKR
jgi:hypothetical protein